MSNRKREEREKRNIPLSANLQTSLNPIDLSRQEELRGPESVEKILLIQRLGGTVVEAVEDVAFEELLVTDTDLRE